MIEDLLPLQINQNFTHFCHPFIDSWTSHRRLLDPWLARNSRIREILPASS